MVKIFSFIFLLIISLNAEDINENIDIISPLDNNASVVLEDESDLIKKIKTFVDEESYKENKKFIEIIFSPQSDYYHQERVNVVKVVQTLKENGLLSLFFDRPQELKLSFKTSGAPLFFVKIMGDTLRNIGYFRYVTSESNLDSSQFTWTITLHAEYATDPLILQRELQKNGSSIIDINKVSANHWQYSIDMSNAYLNLPVLEDGVEFELKRSLYAHWLNIEGIESLQVKSSIRDRWYPHISYYDKSLHLLKVIKKDKKTRLINLEIPKWAKYIKISDMYTLKNVRDNLILLPTGLK